MMDDLTEFQRYIIEALKKSKNGGLNCWEIAWAVRSAQWEIRRKRGAIIRSIVQAGWVLSEKGYIWYIPSHDKNGSPRFVLRELVAADEAGEVTE